MNKFFNNTLLVLILTCGFISLNAQADNNDTDSDDHDVSIVIPNFAILDVEPEATTSITLAADEPTEAGTALNFDNATSDVLWLNYSSIIATGTTRKVTVQLDQAVPNGLVLDVTAAAHAGTGGGTIGTPAATVTLSTAVADIITGIGSCFTGDGDTNGHKLTYELDSDAATYGSIVSTLGTSLTVTYTIVAE